MAIDYCPKCKHEIIIDDENEEVAGYQCPVCSKPKNTKMTLFEALEKLNKGEIKMEVGKSFYEKFAYLQSKIHVRKSNRNSFGNYNYRSCEDIMAALRDICPELGLFVIVSDTIELIGDRYYIKATALISDGDKRVENTAFARESSEKKGMDLAQVTGSTSSYARKYALAGLLGLDDEADPDSRDNRPQEKKNEPEKKQETRPSTGPSKPEEKNAHDNSKEIDATIELIRQSMAALTEGDTVVTKGLAVHEYLGVTKFEELKKLTLIDLKSRLAKVNEAIRERNKNSKPSFKI